jgi:hypothetical protein
MITPSFGLTATERVLPKLALDFTTASLDSRVTFTRSTTATRTNASGFIQSVAIDSPRFDYDPVTLLCKGLLIEQSATNLTLQSEDFSTTWSPTASISVSADVIDTQSPAGDNTADKLIANVGTAQCDIRQSFTFAESTNHTFSVYVKTGGFNWFQIAFLNRANTVIRSYFNVADGVVGTAGSGCVTSISPQGNGWFRCVVSFNSGSGATTSNYIRLQLAAANSTINVTGNGVNGSYVWGAQLETNAFATSYIPTVASQVTRSADVATMTGTNFSDWYSAGAGGVVARVLPSTVSDTRPVLQFDDATANEVITLRGSTTNPELVIVDGGSPQAQIDAGTITANIVYNLGTAWDTDNCAAAVNGAAAVTDTSATIPTVTQARLGSDGTNYLNGHLQTVRYWPQRIINAEVEAFSK